jgi:DNA-binding MarR family transcriptional regulator
VTTTTCLVCQAELDTGGPGRPPRYCSAACRQRAYRSRQRTTAPGRPRRTRQPAPPPSPIEREVPHLDQRELLAWRGVLEVQTLLIPSLETELREHTGLTLSEFDVLYQLWRMPDKRRRMIELARAVLVTPGGVTRIVSRLEDRGLVQRMSTKGRQAVVTALTPRGEQELQTAMDVHFDGVRRRFVQHLTDIDLDLINEIWARIRESGPRHDGVPTRRS